MSISAATPHNFTITHGRAVHLTNTKCLFHGAQRHFTQTKFAFHCAARNSCRREPCHFDQRGEISSLPLSRFRADFSATLEMTMVATDKAAAAIHENSPLFSIHCARRRARGATTFCALYARAHYYIIVKLKNFKNCRKSPKIN